ncbi:MAG: Zn-ribbon domain-containing OB-fold protein [Candidatus Anstonellales archaeon]
MRESVSLAWRRYPERYRMEGSQCTNCGEKFFPPRKVCPNCRRKGKIASFKFSGKGEVYSYTVVFSPPTGFEEQVPYTIVLVKLEEGAMVLGQLVDDGDVRIGDRVEAVFRKIQSDDPEGLIHYGFKFRRV